MSAIPADRRYVRGRRCPICDGADNDPRGQERRCFGFLSEDGLFAHCSRAEHAGSIRISEGSQTYAHRRAGPCGCGAQHSDPTPQPERRRIVAEYDYHDESGAVVYQVVRFEPKTFRQRRRDPDNPSRWLWNLDGMRRVLYHLDRVLEADPSATVYVVEGEKDVHALETLGLVATTSPQGAGKWSAVTDCATKALAGRSIVVIADADKKGREHAADVVAKLAGVAASVRSIEFPQAKDAADWVRDGGTVEKLEALISAQVGSSPSIDLDPSKDFERNEDGKICHTQPNMRLAIAKLNVTLRFNQMSLRSEINGLPNFGPEFGDAELDHLWLLIDERFQFRISIELFRRFVEDFARRNSYHPVREYLASLHWDGVKRLDGWLTTYGGAADTPYARAVGNLMMLAAVRRVRKPGIKFDEMLILETPEQGKNKSTALRTLAVRDEWFTDQMPLGEKSREMMEATCGKWIVECGELRGMDKASEKWLKSYLAAQSDHGRPAYARKNITVPRQFVVFGSTNEEDGYLADQTGNRRYWPVRVVEFDIEKLTKDRDQLWAEAAHREALGESIRLSPSLYGAAAEEQEKRRQRSSFEIVLTEKLRNWEGSILVTDAWIIAGVPSNRPPTQAEMTAIGKAMNKLGWEHGQRRLDGQRPPTYTRGRAGEWIRAGWDKVRMRWKLEVGPPEPGVDVDGSQDSIADEGRPLL